MYVVFVLHRLDHRFPPSVDVAQQGGVALAAVDEDAALNVGVALLGVVVHLAQSPLRHVVVVDVALQLNHVLAQQLPDAFGQHQTGVALAVAVLRGHHVGHRLQT